MKTSASRPRPTSKESCRTARRSCSHAARSAPRNPTMPGCTRSFPQVDPISPGGPSWTRRLELQASDPHSLHRPRHTGHMSELSSSGHAIETLQVEKRRYPPSAEFSKRANAKPEIYERQFDEFWTEESRRITFFEPWNKLYEW